VYDAIAPSVSADFEASSVTVRPSTFATRSASGLAFGAGSCAASGTAGASMAAASPDTASVWRNLLTRRL
jgi:hypothetical protein